MDRFRARLQTHNSSNGKRMDGSEKSRKAEKQNRKKSRMVRNCVKSNPLRIHSDQLDFRIFLADSHSQPSTQSDECVKNERKKFTLCGCARALRSQLNRFDVMCSLAFALCLMPIYLYIYCGVLCVLNQFKYLSFYFLFSSFHLQHVRRGRDPYKLIKFIYTLRSVFASK